MRALLVAVVMALALVAAGCGGDDEALPAEEWADEFCTLVQDWQDDLVQIGDELQQDLSTESFEEAAEEANSLTEDFVQDLRDLGAPDTESGDVVEQEVEELGDTVDTEREELRQAVEQADDLGGVAQAIGKVGASIAAMTTAAEETLTAIDNADPGGELTTAVEEAPACDELTD